MSDAYLKTVERMERDITPVDHAAAIASIAISLKRIADALNSPNEFPTIGFTLAEMLTQIGYLTRR